MSQNIALVAGASGIIGRGLIDALGAAPGWRVRALGRRAVSGVETITADLLDRASLAGALAAASDTTHLFYAAYLPQPSLEREVEVNGAMLDALLDGLAETGTRLRRVVLYQGAKVYGVHLGPVVAPFYEDDPRHLPPNFYYTHEDRLRRGVESGAFEFTLLRPDVVVGDAVGNPMNIATVIGAYAAICRATGTPFRFPGPEHVYRGVLAQLTDARLLGRASLWAADTPQASGEAFNYVHEPFRWERLWTRIAAALDLPVGPPMPMRLADHMPAHGPLWQRIVSEHGLVPTALDRLVGWKFGDFVFNTGFDMVSDMGKIRRAGFTETTDNVEAVLGAIRRLEAQRILP